MVVVDYSKGSMKPSEEAERTRELQWADRNADISFLQAQFVQLLNFFKRPWFERLWIRQEVRLATYAIVICGLDSLSWNLFQNAVFCLEAKKSTYGYRLEKQYQDDWFNHIALIWGLCDTDLRDFPSHMDLARHSRCSDPRDRVYALLSTSDLTTQAIRILPNYRKSVEEVYQDVFLQYAMVYVS